MASMSSAQIVSASVLHSKALAAAGMPSFNNENPGYHGQVCSAATVGLFYPKIRCMIIILFVAPLFFKHVHVKPLSNYMLKTYGYQPLLTSTAQV